MVVVEGILDHCNSGLWGLWEVGVPGRYFSPLRGLMDHCDGGFMGGCDPWNIFSPIDGPNGPLC